MFRSAVLARAASFLLVLGLAGPVAAQTHPFGVKDMWDMDRLSSLAVSPDGTQVVFEVRGTDYAKNGSTRDIYIMNADGSKLRALTTDPASDSGPCWSADGTHIYFLSSRSGSTQVWKIAVAGGEAQAVTKLPLDVANLKLAPDGRQLAVTMEVFPDCETLECTVERLKSMQGPRTGQVFDELFVRHWDTWKDGRRNHLFVMTEGGKPIDVTKGVSGDVPSKPFGGAEEFTFTPNSEGIVFTMREGGSNEAWSTDFDLYIGSVNGKWPPKCLTEENEAWDTNPVFSPDGKTLSYLAMKTPVYEADRYRIVTRTWNQTKAMGPARWNVGPAQWLTEEWDRSPSSITWDPSGTNIYCHAQHLGNRALFAVSAKTGQATPLVTDGTVTAEAVAGRKVLMLRHHFHGPAEVYAVGKKGGKLEQVTHVNDKRVAQIRMGDYEQYTFKGAGGDQVYGWIIKPVDFQKGRKYPVAFIIHGGPQGSSANQFHYRWNPQAYAGAGYAVVMVDFHGSTGYGQAFTDAITGDWGGKPLEDLKLGLKAALARNEWMDGERVGALGASYGGYMINWIAGTWPERFACLINHDGILDNRMAYYTTEELWFPEHQFKGTYWQNPQGYEKHNPVNHVDKWKTPMLVIHGGLDYRLPEEHGIAAFTVLQRKGIPSRFIYYGDENHWILTPANAAQWHEEVIGWLDRFCKNDS